jgi:predicted ABC-type sugar transport system permease subunit
MLDPRISNGDINPSVFVYLIAIAVVVICVWVYKQTTKKQ